MTSAEDKKMPGVIGDLARVLGARILAEILGCLQADLERFAQNKFEPLPPQAETLADLCRLHGVRPGLYVYAAWADHKGILIQNPGNWTATSLLNPRWGTAAPHWTGNPTRELKLADDETLALAREKGWPW